MEKRLAEIQARAETATKGPWVTGGTASCGDVYFGTLVDPDDHSEPGVMLGMTGQPADAEFIASAREDVPWLLAEVARLNAKLVNHEINKRELAKLIATTDKWRNLAMENHAKLADAWDEGYEACHEYEAEWLVEPTNPYRSEVSRG